MPKLKYHQAIFDMLQREPVFSEANIAALNEQEKKLGITFPASVREWYSLEDTVKILYDYSDTDEPLEIRELKAITQYNKCIFFISHEGVYAVSFSLSHSPDPPVYRYGDPIWGNEDSSGWALWYPNFSHFIYNWIWDQLYIRKYWPIVATKASLLQADLDFLRSNFSEVNLGEIQRTNIQTYRFESMNQHLEIIVEADELVSWWIGTDTLEALRDFLVIIGESPSFTNDHYQSFHEQILDNKEASRKAEKMLEELQNQ